MRACSTILLISFLMVCAPTFGQDEAANTIAALEPAVKDGSATRAQQLDLARAYVTVGRYYEADQIAGRLITADANDQDAIAIRDQSKQQLRVAGQQRVTDAEA